MNIYNYDDNGFFTNSTIADESPLEPGSFLMPANSTGVLPPHTEGRQIARFADGEWAVVPDLRGVKYWLNGKEHEITKAGIELPAGASAEKPESVVTMENKKKVEDIQFKTRNLIKLKIIEETSTIIGTEDKDRQARFEVNQAAARALIGEIATDAQREMLQRQLDRQVTRGKQPYVGMDLQQFAAVIVQRGDIAVRASGMIEDIYMFAMDRVETVQTEADQQALLVELGGMVEAAKRELEG